MELRFPARDARCAVHERRALLARGVTCKCGVLLMDSAWCGDGALQQLADGFTCFAGTMASAASCTCWRGRSWTAASLPAPNNFRCAAFCIGAAPALQPGDDQKDVAFFALHRVTSADDCDGHRASPLIFGIPDGLVIVVILNITSCGHHPRQLHDGVLLQQAILIATSIRMQILHLLTNFVLWNVLQDALTLQHSSFSDWTVDAGQHSPRQVSGLPLVSEIANEGELRHNVLIFFVPACDASHPAHSAAILQRHADTLSQPLSSRHLWNVQLRSCWALKLRPYIFCYRARSPGHAHTRVGDGARGPECLHDVSPGDPADGGDDVPAVSMSRETR